jgi:putative addiction module component (TIGR02574 family)
MTATIDRIRREATQLSYDEREALVRVLELDLDGVTPDGESAAEIEAAWDAELETRVADVESGRVKLLSRAEFNSAFSEARQKLAANH